MTKNVNDNNNNNKSQDEYKIFCDELKTELQALNDAKKANWHLEHNTHSNTSTIVLLKPAQQALMNEYDLQKMQPRISSKSGKAFDLVLKALKLSGNCTEGAAKYLN